MSYAIRRSIKNKTIHLVFMESHFDELPEHVRSQGPWQHLKSGDFVNLIGEYRELITKSGYAIVDSNAAVFSAESGDVHAANYTAQT